MIPSRFASNALRSVGIGLLALIPSLVLPALYARTLPAADLAAWLYAFSIATYVTAFHLGVAPATSALVSREEKDPRSRAAILLGAAALLTLATSLATAALLVMNAAGWFRADASAAYGDENFRTLLTLAIIGTAATLPLHAWAGYCTGIFQVGRLFPISLLQKLSLTVFAIVAALVWHDAGALAWSHLASGLLTAAVLAIVIGREILPYRADAIAQWRPRLRALLGYSLPAALSGLAQLPLAGVHTVIVAREIPEAIVPFAALAPALTLIAGMIWSIMSNLLPEMSAGFTEARGRRRAQRRRRQHRLLLRAVGLLAVALLLVQLAIVAGLPWFLRWAVTERWADAHLGGLAAYAAALTLRQLTLPMGLAFFSDGKPWQGLLPTWAEAIVSIAFALLLTPAYGFAGLAGSVLIGVAVNIAISPWLLRAVGAVSSTRPVATRSTPLTPLTPSAPEPGLTRPLIVSSCVTTALMLLSLRYGDPASTSVLRPLAFTTLIIAAGFVLLPGIWWLGLAARSRRTFLDSLATTVQRIGRTARPVEPVEPAKPAKPAKPARLARPT